MFFMKILMMSLVQESLYMENYMMMICLALTVNMQTNSVNKHEKLLLALVCSFVNSLFVFADADVAGADCASAVNVEIISFAQGLLYHRTCKPDFLCSWPSLNSYLN